MNMASFAKNIKNTILNKLSGDMSGVFIATTIIGYLAGAAGQLYGISKNDKLDADKKKFLRFQELADCVINMFAYFTITKACTKFSKNLASSGKILSKGLADKCKQCNIDLKNVKNIGSEITNRLNKLNATQQVLSEKNIKTVDNAAAKLNSEIKNLNALKDKYVPFENGMSMLGTIAGGLVSADIISPIMRNKYAAMKQKQDKPTVTYNYPNMTNKSSGMRI